MWLKRIFEGPSRQKTIKLLKAEGSLVGERQLEGRKVYLYLLRDFFVQVMYLQDDPAREVEHLQTFSDINKLNSHLEKEFRATN